MTHSIKNLLLFAGAVLLGIVFYIAQGAYHSSTLSSIPREPSSFSEAEYASYSKIVFAGGCFWSTEGAFNHIPGVVAAVSGFTGGTVPNPTYEEVGGGATGHREAVVVYYNEASTTVDTLLQIYWKSIDPTDPYGTFVDKGYQYTTAIYYTTELQHQAALLTKQRLIDVKKFDTPIVTEILPYKNFYAAEDYHQDYKDKNPTRYELYRRGSGRDEFIKKYWANDTTTFTLSRATTTIITMNTPTANNNTNKNWKSFVKPTDAELHNMLTPEEYNVTQKEGTERPFANKYEDNHEKGLYVDIVSGEPLFLSVDKYDSGSGWPSFVKPVASNSVTFKQDKELFMTRTEVRSSIADSHLGHVFDDGPQDRGGKRYCMNSVSMKFIPLADMEKEGYGEYVAQLK
jgi:peptide methionine sulfoxide reductase msrA/msrB